MGQDIDVQPLLASIQRMPKTRFAFYWGTPGRETAGPGASGARALDTRRTGGPGEHR